MDLFANLAIGFSVAFTSMNLAYALVGVTLGTLIGVLPGLGPVPTIAMLLPITFGLEPASALIMLAGIYYGAQYGGSTTAILVNMPGEANSVVTCLDGHQMARNGQAGAALATAALSSLFAGTVVTGLIAVVSVPLSSFALKFGPHEFFSLMVLGLIGSVVLAQGSLVKAVAMIFLGLVLSSIGTDVDSGIERFTFGFSELADGIAVVTVAMGLFGITDIMLNLEKNHETTSIAAPELKKLWISRDQFRAAWPAALRGTGLGSVLGMLPGGGALLSTFAAYAVEKKVATDPSRFGKGAIEGVAGPEAANNAGAQSSFIPLLTLGIPENAVMALMIGAMMIHNIQPGPQVVKTNPELYWGLIVSMWVGNFLLVVLNLPMIGMWVKVLKVPYRLLFPVILVVCSIGIYTVNNGTFDLYVMAAFGVLGVVFFKLDCEPTPLILGFILGPMMEENLRRAMQLSSGDFTDLVTRPISGGILACALTLVAAIVLPNLLRRRGNAVRNCV